MFNIDLPEYGDLIASTRRGLQAYEYFFNFCFEDLLV